MPIVVRPKDKQNPFKLTEAEIFQTQSISDIDFTIGFDSIFNEQRVFEPIKGDTIIVRLKKARLELILVSCRISTKGRAGNTPRPSKAVEKVARTETVLKEGAISGDGAAEAGVTRGVIPYLKARISGGVSGKASKSVHLKRTEKEENIRTNIMHVGNGEWEVSDVYDETLKGRYCPDDHLCHIEVAGEAGSVEGRVYFYAEDMEIGPPPDTTWSIPSNSAKYPLMKALIKRGLSELNEIESKKDGRLVISTTTLNYSIEAEDE